MKTPLFILIIFSVVQISCSNQNFDIIIDNKRNETTDSLLVYVQGKRFIVDHLEATQRSSIKVKLSLISLNAHDFKKLYHKDFPILIKAKVLSSELMSVPTIQKISKKAIIDNITNKSGENVDEDKDLATM